MIVLTKEQIIDMHVLLIKETGGMRGIRAEGLLESAINGPFQTFMGNDLYPSIKSKAAALCYGLISNHAFNDGNKRIGILAMLTFLELNGTIIECSDDELIELGLNTASGALGQKDILEWIIKHS